MCVSGAVARCWGVARVQIAVANCSYFHDPSLFAVQSSLGLACFDSRHLHGNFHAVRCRVPTQRWAARSEGKFDWSHTRPLLIHRHETLASSAIPIIIYRQSILLTPGGAKNERFDRRSYGSLVRINYIRSTIANLLAINWHQCCLKVTEIRKLCTRTLKCQYLF